VYVFVCEWVGMCMCMCMCMCVYVNAHGSACVCKHARAIWRGCKASRARVQVGLSGGKDSLSLLHILMALQKKAPIHFEIGACTVDPQTPEYDPSVLKVHPLSPPQPSLRTYSSGGLPSVYNAKI